MDNTEKIVRQFMSETKPYTYKDNDGRLMTDLANFFDWLAKNKQLTLTDVVSSAKDKEPTFKEMREEVLSNKLWKKKDGLYWHFKWGTKTLREAYKIAIS